MAVATATAIVTAVVAKMLPVGGTNNNQLKYREENVVEKAKAVVRG